MLALKDVHAFYDLHHILHGISLEVNEGEILAVLGRNGAGKTTTVRTIMGLLHKCNGSITYRDTELIGLEPHVINRMGVAYVPEYRGIFSDLSVDENLHISALRQGEWTIERVLELFPQLRELGDRKGRHISGGEQQMLAIGRALLSSPRVLLLDEPSQGLAPVIVDTVVETLHKLRDENIGILLVEQNAAIAVELANRVCIIDQGAIVYQGSVEEMRENPDIIATYVAVG